MFGNMDNNQNFNNNQFNNMNGMPNYQNQGIFSGQNNMQPNMQNGVTPQIQTMQQPAMPQGEMPPQLEDIKPLSNAPIASAPTMDVLGPMNIMPEYPEAPQGDKLDAYESGNFNLNQDYSNIGQPLSAAPSMDNLNYNPAMSPMPEYQKQPSLNNAMNHPGFDNISSNIGASSETESTFLSPNNYSVSERQYEKPDSVVMQNTQTEQEMSISSDIDVQQENYDVPEIVQDSLASSKESEEQNYEINNSESLSEEESYTKEDELVIDNKDEESDFTEEKVAIEEDEKIEIVKSEDYGSLRTYVEQIKELVDKIRENGVKIQFEEFDFEQMYQLIIKINK